MKIMVTGGAGFIGSNFIHYLSSELSPSDHVIVIDKLTYAGRRENIQDLIDANKWVFHEVDICDTVRIDSLMATHKPDVVVHFAAESHVSRSVSGPMEFTKTNVLGTQVLLEAIRKADLRTRFIHISTDEVFGQLSEWEKSWNDYSPINPRSPYASSKAAGELMARSYFTTYGFDVIIVRPANAFGPMQFPEKMIPRSVTNLLQGENIMLMGQGLQMRDWLHVHDLATYLHLIIDEGHSGECYNIPGDAVHRNRDIVAALLDIMGLGWDRVTEIPHRLAHDFKYHVDGHNIKNLIWEHSQTGETSLQFDRSKETFHQKLEETIEWYEMNEDWWKPLKQEGESGNEGADSGRRNG